MKLSTVVALSMAALSMGGACKRSAREVVVYTSVDQVFSEPIFKEFERQSGLAVRAVFDTEETKSTGVLNRLLTEAQRPQADVFWSGDPVRPFVLVGRGLVEPYVSGSAEGIPGQFKAADGAWAGFAARARVLLVNKKRLGTAGQPKSINDLVDPRWKGQAAIANPIFGTTTIHAAALWSVWGHERTQALFNQLKTNGVRIASSNGEVKRLVASGEVTFGVADTDDASEAVKEGAPVDVVFPDQDALGTLVMPTTAVLIKGAPHADTGRKLIDFLLSPDVEKRMAEAAGHMPLRAAVPVPKDVRRANDIKAMQVDYAKVADIMERIQPWLREWAGLR